MTARLLVVVSGLAASGKTTMGTLLSERLTLPLIDKDAILESLFDSLGSPDSEARTRLSRASDEVLYRLAEASHASILVNWWNHDSAPQRLRDIATSIVEVHCDCPVEVAAERFQARRRRPGHHDGDRSAEEVKDGITRLRDNYRGPLGVGELVRIDTSRPVDPEHATELVRTAMAVAVPAG